MDATERFRPRRFKDVVGQPDAVKVLSALLARGPFPHATLLSGASGCGKTTLARILRTKLKCGTALGDYTEINAAVSRGIDTVRDILNSVNRSPIGGDCRVWVIDEAHQLTKDAQTGLLKILEDVPDTAYFILCTTDATKLLRTIITRCTEVKLRTVGPAEMKAALAGYAKGKTKVKLDDVLDTIVAAAEGSMRKAVVVLNQVVNLDNEDDMMAAVASSDTPIAVFELVKVMCPWQGKPSWSAVSKVLEGIKDEDPEGVRRLILSVARGQMMKGGKPASQGFRLFECFRDNYFDSGKTGLVASCWEFVNPG